MRGAPYWFELAVRYRSEGRIRDAADAFIRAAESGTMTQMITVQMHVGSAMREVMSEPAYVRRMRRIATSDPGSAPKQLAVGAFLLDHGHLDEGRTMVRRGHELIAPEHALSTSQPTEESSAKPPHFVLIGPQKTGTTTLYRLLCNHPHVVAAPRKELHFWGHRHGRSLEHYDAYFPTLRDGFVTGEASATYLYLPEAARGIAEHYPHTRVIAFHREPVSRAHSHFHMTGRARREPRTFEQAVGDEIAQLGASAPCHAAADVIAPHCQYLMGSCILPYLEMWVDALGSSRVMVVESDGLAKDRQATVDSIHEFLGLPTSSVDGIPDHNVFEYEAVSAPIEERLREWFRPHEDALAEFFVRHPDVARAGHG